MSSENEATHYVFQEVGRYAYLIPRAIIVCVSLLTNVSAIIVSLLSPNLRKTPKHFIIINISVVAILIAAFPQALLVELYARNKWIHGCTFFTEELVYYVLDAIYLLLMASLSLESSISLVGRAIRPKLKYILTVLSVGVSWVINCEVLIPIAIEGRHDPDYCGFWLEEDYQTAINVLSYFPQAFLTVLFVSFLLVKHCINRSKPGNARSDWITSLLVDGVSGRSASSVMEGDSEGTASHPVEEVSGGMESFPTDGVNSGTASLPVCGLDEGFPSFPIDVVVASCITVVMKFPFSVYLLVRCGIDCDSAVHLNAHCVLSTLSSAVPALVPFAWLLCRETREAIVAICKRKRRQNYVPFDEDVNSMEM